MSEPGAAALAQASALRFEERSPWEAGFSHFFDEEILPALVMLEQRRWRAKQRARTRLIVALVFWFAMLGLGLWTLTWRDPGSPLAIWTWMGAFAAGCVVSFWASLPARDYAEGRKAVLGPMVARFLGDLQFDPAGMTTASLWKTGLFGTGHDGSTADRLTGRVAGHPFAFCEARLTRSAGKSTALIFEGWVLSLEVGASTGQWALLDVGERRLAPGLFSDTGWREGQIWHKAGKRVWLLARATEPPAEVVEALIAFEPLVSPGRLEAIYASKRLWVFVSAQLDRFVPDGVHENALGTDDLRRFLSDAWHLRELARRLASGVLGVERGALPARPAVSDVRDA